MAIAKHVVRRKDPTGRVRYYFKTPKWAVGAGKMQAYVPLGNDERFAKVKAETLNRELGRGRTLKTEWMDAYPDGTVGALVREFLKGDYVVTLSDNSRQSYDAKLRMACLRGEIADLPVGQVSPMEASRAVAKMLQASTPLMVGQSVGLLRLIWNRAMPNDMNPWANVKGPRGEDLVTRKGRDVMWADDDVTAFRNAAEEMGYPEIGAAVLLGYVTWQRPSDVRKMGPDNLKSCVFEGERTNMLELVQKKTGTLIQQPKPDPEIVALLEQPGGAVINPRTGEPYGRDAFEKVFRRIAKKAGLPDELQFRDLRRTGATEAANKGVDVAQIKSAGGWKSDAVYAYVRRTPKQAYLAISAVQEARAKRRAGG